MWRSNISGHDEGGEETSPGDANPARLLRHALLYALARVGLGGLDVLLLPFYARLLSPAEFGLVSIAASVMAVMAIVYVAGFDGALQALFFGRPHGSREQRSLVAGCVACMAAVGLGIAIGISALGPSPFGGLLSGMDTTVFRLVIWSAFLNLFVNAWLQLLQLHQRSRQYLWLSLGSAGVRAVAIVLAVGVLQRGAIGWAEACAWSALLTGLVAIVGLRPHFSTFSPAAIIRAALPFAVPLLIHQIAGWLWLSAGRLVINQLTTLESVGVYQVAVTVGQALGLLATAVNFAYAPAFLAAAAKSREGAGRTFGEFASQYLVALAAVAVLLSLFRVEVVHLVASGAFKSASGLVPIVLATTVIQGLYYVVANPILIDRGSVRFLPFITVAGAVIGLGVTYVLVPHWGIAGAVIATITASTVVVLAAMPLSQASVRMTYDWKRFALVTVLGAATVAASEVLPQPPGSRVIVNGALAALFLVTSVRLGILRLAVYRQVLVAAFSKSHTLRLTSP